MKKSLRGFEVVKGYEDKGIHIPERKTAHAAGYDIEAAEDVIMPMYKPGMKPTLIPTGQMNVISYLIEALVQKKAF